MIYAPSNPNELAEILKQATPSHGRDVDHTKLRYVIYARKSTDEEGKQVHSVEDQVAVCLEFANKNDINVRKEDILMEKMSAKELGMRSVFLEMLRKFRAGDYDGIIAWHPDHLARNMKEAGEMIDLLDKHVIQDLKFPSFTFNNDQSGKLLLGITFALSKEYSDKLSVNVKRGNRLSMAEDKLVSGSKHVYVKGVNGYLRPDGQNFVLLKQAFNMRLEGKTLEQISGFLIENKYFHRNTIGSKECYKMTKQKIKVILIDPVCVRIIQHGENTVNLLKHYDFVPMITVEQFMTINHLSDKSDLIKLAKSYKKGEDVVADLLREMVICGECEETMTAGITPKKNKKGEVTRYFYYGCDNLDCHRYGKSTRAKIILKYVTELLEKKPFSSQKSYEHYKLEIKRVNAERVNLARHKLLSLQTERVKLMEKIEDVKNLLLNKDEGEGIKKWYRGDL